MSILKIANLGLSFFLELAAIAAFAFWGYQAGGTPLIKIVLLVVAPLLSAMLWGILAAPRAPRRLTGWRLPAFKLLFFALAAAALAVSGLPALALILAVAVLVNLALVYAWKQE